MGRRIETSIVPSVLVKSFQAAISESLNTSDKAKLSSPSHLVAIRHHL